MEALFNLLYQIVRPERQHKLFHIHGIHRFHIDFPDGERKFCPVDRNAEQAACDNDVILRSVFTEVFEWSQCSFAELHLVKDDQRLLFHDGLTCNMRQNRDQVIGTDVFRKGLIQLWIGFKVEVHHIFIVGAPELQNGVCLSDLPCPLQNKGLAVFAFFPRFQKAYDFPIHIQPSSRMLRIL